AGSKSRDLASESSIVGWLRRGKRTRPRVGRSSRDDGRPVKRIKIPGHSRVSESLHLEASMPDRPESIDRRSFAAIAAAALAAAGLPAELSAQEGGDTLKSELLMEVMFDVAAPQNLGARLIVPVTGGTFTGPKLKGTALPGGSDAILRRADGASLLNVR